MHNQAAWTGKERSGVACVRRRAAGEKAPFGSCQGPFRCHLCHAVPRGVRWKARDWIQEA